MCMPFAFDKGVAKGGRRVWYVRKLNNVAPQFLPVVGAVFGNVTVVHDVVWFVHGHAVGNACAFKWLHGYNVGVVVSRVGRALSQCVRTARVQPSTFVGDFQIVARGLTRRAGALE